MSNNPTKSIWKKYIFTFLSQFLIGGLVIQIIFYPIDPANSWEEFWQEILFNGTLWVVLWFGNGWLNDFMTKKFGWNKPIEIFIFRNIATVFVSLFLAYFVFFIFFYINGDKSLMTTFNRIWRELNFFTIFTISTITLIISLFLHGTTFLLSWKESILETERLKKEQITSQYEALKNQINPHFLFNSLNVLSTLVYKDQDLAAKFIKQLSDSYRYVLDTREEEVVPLSKELKALESFIFLMKIRFGKNLNIQLNLPTKNQENIAPLTLQMLVENAIKHNIISKKKPLEISITKKENGYIQVSNNLQKKSQLSDSTGIGLPNIKARYLYLAKKEVIVEETKTQFIVRIPILTFQESKL